MLSDEYKTMDKEQFTTMLLHAASIVNSTPLWDSPDSPNDPQPISPQRLLTQRDDTCKDTNFLPTIYTEDDLQAYGSERWKRIEAIANHFWSDWKKYIYDIGTERTKWPDPKRNAKQNDIVLICEKNTPRLQWSTGAIIEIKTDKDGLVRRVIVQPHKRPGKATTEAQGSYPGN